MKYVSQSKIFAPNVLWLVGKYLIFIILWKMSEVYAWNKKKNMCTWNERSTGKLLTHCLNTLTRVCLCCTASVTPRYVTLEMLIFLQNACWTKNSVSFLDSPGCRFASTLLEVTLLPHECYVPWQKWKSWMCKDQVRKKSSMLAFRNGFAPVDTSPLKSWGYVLIAFAGIAALQIGDNIVS